MVRLRPLLLLQHLAQIQVPLELQLDLPDPPLDKLGKKNLKLLNINIHFLLYSASSFSFGAPAASTQPPAFGLSTNTVTSSAPSLFGGTSTTFSGFGAPASSQTTFSGFGTTTTSQAPLFGGTSTAPSLFGNTGGTSNFGFGTTTSTGFSGFGTSTGFSGFGQPQQQQQQQQQAPQSAEDIFSQAIFNVSIFGDERDTVIARWNYLQALFGTGKAVYSQSQPPYDINTQNSLCRFKAMGYSKIPGKDNKLGLVGIKFNKPFAQMKGQESQLIQRFSQLFGSKPNLMIHIDSIKALTETATQVIIYVEEKLQNSTESKRITATESSNFLNQTQIKYQWPSIGIEEVYAIVTLDEDQLKQYLERPPKGVDARMWRQAIADNPDAKKFIPVPLVGFNDLKSRLACQETETSSHMSYLAKLEKDISELKLRHSNTATKITEQRRKLAELSHRILRIIVKQESTRKAGLALTPEEEIIKTKLENMHALVSAPTQFKGKLNELLAQMRMQRSQWTAIGGNEYTLDKESSDEMKNFLSMHQKAMEVLIDTINQDTKDLKIISEGMSRIGSVN